MNAYERAAAAAGGCKVVGSGVIDGWTKRTLIDKGSLERFRAECVRVDGGVGDGA